MWGIGKSGWKASIYAGLEEEKIGRNTGGITGGKKKADDANGVF